MWTIVVPKYKTGQTEWQSWPLGFLFPPSGKKKKEAE